MQLYSNSLQLSSFFVIIFLLFFFLFKMSSDRSEMAMRRVAHHASALGAMAFYKPSNTSVHTQTPNEKKRKDKTRHKIK